MKIKILEGCELTGYDIVAGMILRILDSYDITPDCSIIVRIGELSRDKNVVYRNELFMPIYDFWDLKNIKNWEWETDWWEGEREFYFGGFTLITDVSMDYVPDYIYSNSPHCFKVIHDQRLAWAKDLGDISWLVDSYNSIEVMEDTDE